jgi:hypothetical protein
MEDLLLDRVRSLKPRPQFEANRRAGRSTVITVTMASREEGRTAHIGICVQCQCSLGQSMEVVEKQMQVLQLVPASRDSLRMTDHDDADF